MALAPVDTLFDEILEFLASTPTPEQIVIYEPPESLQHRLSELLDKNRADQLTPAESGEMEEFLRLDRFMSRLKLKARPYPPHCRTNSVNKRTPNPDAPSPGT